MTDQTAAVYAAEDAWMGRDPAAQRKFGDWDEVWPFYYGLAKRCREAGVYDVKPPQIKARKGALKAHYDPAERTVFLPPYKSGGAWALNTGTVIHEFAHHMAPGAGHGPEFRKAMIHCLEVLGWDEEVLVSCYQEAGLSSSEREEGTTHKVNKLLSHADGATTPEERRAFLDKAEGLAAEHSLNLALLRKKQADQGQEHDRPQTSQLFSLAALPSTTYRNLAVELGSSIAYAHGLQCMIRGKSMFLTFLGFAEDIELTELMLTRITPMMFEESDRYLKSPEHKASGVAGVSARITFCKQFSLEIGHRLVEAAEARQGEVRQALEIGGASAEIALRDKAVEVRDYANYEFKRRGVRGSWKGSSTQNASFSAADAGRDAARNANLYGRKELA